MPSVILASENCGKCHCGKCYYAKSHSAKCCHASVSYACNNVSNSFSRSTMFFWIVLLITAAESKPQTELQFQGCLDIRVLNDYCRSSRCKNFYTKNCFQGPML